MTFNDLSLSHISQSLSLSISRSAAHTSDRPLVYVPENSLECEVCGQINKKVSLNLKKVRKYNYLQFRCPIIECTVGEPQVVPAKTYQEEDWYITAIETLTS